MSFTFLDTNICDLKIIKPHVFLDSRGAYKKYYEKEEFAKQGIDCLFNESSNLFSCKGALRGLHYQTKYSQAKLIHVISGSIYDVALDLRSNSPTFGKFYADILTSNEDKLIYIPEGFAHGFISLEDNTIFSYQCSGKYVPEYCGGILWNDPDLNIKWPINEYKIDKIIATDKDLEWPSFNEYLRGI